MKKDKFLALESLRGLRRYLLLFITLMSAVTFPILLLIMPG
mgnify:CR=1 FL=1